MFWLLCATDGHAKNFSVFIEPRGRYRLTPRYDVLSVYPMIGPSYAVQEAKMAMAVTGKNRHYRWDRIERRHWLETAHRCGFAAHVEEILDELVAATPGAVERVASSLPAGFPARIAEPILQGLTDAARRLAP